MSDPLNPKAILAAAFERGQEFERGRWQVLARSVVRGAAVLASRVDEEPDKDTRTAIRVRHGVLSKIKEMIPDADQYEEEE